MRKGPRDALQLGGLLTFGGLANLELVTFYWKAVPFNVLMWGYRELVLKAKNSTTIFDKFKFTISNSKFHIQDLQNIFQLNHETKSTFLEYQNSVFWSKYEACLQWTNETQMWKTNKQKQNRYTKSWILSYHDNVYDNLGNKKKQIISTSWRFTEYNLKQFAWRIKWHSLWIWSSRNISPFEHFRRY